MINKKIARRYAKALLEIGKETNQVEKFKEELSAFSDLLKQIPELEKFLLSPLYSAEDLKKIIAEIAQKTNFSPTTKNFLFLLVDKRRIQHFSDIYEMYEDYTNELSGHLKAKITTAASLSAEDQEAVKQTLEKATDKKIILSAVVEPEIIGGVIAEVGDKVFDGSIKNQLQKIEETLT